MSKDKQNISVILFNENLSLRLKFIINDALMKIYFNSFSRVIEDK